MQKVVIIDYLPGGESKTNDNSAKRAEVQAELAKLTIKPFSFEEFAKGVKDRDALKMAKKAWKKAMKESVPGWTAKSDYYVSKATL